MSFSIKTQGTHQVITRGYFGKIESCGKEAKKQPWSARFFCALEVCTFISCCLNSAKVFSNSTDSCHQAISTVSRFRLFFVRFGGYSFPQKWGYSFPKPRNSFPETKKNLLFECFSNRSVLPTEHKRSRNRRCTIKLEVG